MNAGNSQQTMSDALPVGVRLGVYKILRVLGQGGFGVTYLALNCETNKQVVIKENLPTQFAGRDKDSLTVTSRGGRDGADNFEWAMQRFLEEARLLAHLNHPNIVRVLRAFSALGTAYYVMPWVGGRDLKQFAAARGGVDEAFLRGVLSKLLPALSYLHSHNLLHRDIKPANILCADDGTPILIDFGTARALVSERSQTMVESAGFTPMEQIQSHGNTGPWTDLYALGATLYTLVTGEHPPRSSDRMGKTDCYVPLAGRAGLKGRYSGGFLESIDKALAVWPEDRWQSADAWNQALNSGGNRQSIPQAAPLQRDVSPLPAGSGDSGMEKRGKQPPAPQPRLVLAWCMIVVTLVFIFMIYWPRGGTSNPPAVQTPRAGMDVPIAPETLPNTSDQAEAVDNVPGEDADFLYREGVRFENGEGVAKDLQQADTWYTLAAVKGHPEAQYKLAERYEKGIRKRKDMHRAVVWYRKAAEQGHAAAQCRLGRCYAEGEGMDKDLREAVAWYRKAAEQGERHAQRHLGYSYYRGAGVDKDLSAAVAWYRKAAEQGDAESQYSLGYFYYNGGGVAKDLREAVAWYRKAAEQGDAAAQYSMGFFYSRGEGVQKDSSAAVAWYRKAAEQGHAAAQYHLGKSYYSGEGVVAKDLKEAAGWYRKAADQGYADAQCDYGNLCYYGEGRGKDLDQAVTWYRKAADQGNVRALYNLGNCYAYGDGVEKDLDKAREWYRKAADQGDPDAQLRLGELLRQNGA